MTRAFDIVVFGASGFTGKYVVAELAKVAPKANVRWAVAGRDASKIKSTLAGLVGMGKTMPFIIEADVFAVESLDNMCSQTKVLIDCVGPFRFFGEQVVKACIKNRTDYVDITGEPEFIENMMYKYSKLAQDSGVSIVPACGFDSIPSEFAVVYAKREMSQQAVTPSAVELFIRAKGSGTSSPQVNYGTYESLIHSIASMNNLRKLRQQFKRPKIPVVGPKLKLNPWPHWESRVKSYVIPFFFADPTIVRISQQLVEEGVWSKKAPKPEPVQFLAYIMLPNLLSALGFLGWLLLISIMSQFQVTRKLALDHPRLFSFGVFSRQGPTEEHLKLAGFKSTVFASGYSKGRAQGSESVPDYSLNFTVTGPEMGYVTTPICVVNSAIVMAQEKDKIPTGVLTPAIAFGATTLLDRLSHDCLKFKILSEK